MGSVQERASLGAVGAGSSNTPTSVLRLIPLFVFLALSVSACSTPQERAARRQAEVEQMMVEYGPACVRLGYTANTDAWRACVLQLNARDDLRRYQTSPGYYEGWGPGYWNGGGWWRPIW